MIESWNGTWNKKMFLKLSFSTIWAFFQIPVYKRILMEIIRSSFLKMRQGFHRRPDRQKAEGLIIVVNQSPKRLELCKVKKMKNYF